MAPPVLISPSLQFSESQPCQTMSHLGPTQSTRGIRPRRASGESSGWAPRLPAPQRPPPACQGPVHQDAHLLISRHTRDRLTASHAQARRCLPLAAVVLPGPYWILASRQPGTVPCWVASFPRWFFFTRAEASVMLILAVRDSSEASSRAVWLDGCDSVEEPPLTWLPVLGTNRR